MDISSVNARRLAIARLKLFSAILVVLGMLSVVAITTYIGVLLFAFVAAAVIIYYAGLAYNNNLNKKLYYNPRLEHMLGIQSRVYFLDTGIGHSVLRARVKTVGQVDIETRKILVKLVAFEKRGDKSKDILEDNIEVHISDLWEIGR